MKKDKGMSIVEVVIAMLLLTIALMAIASSFISSTRLMAHTVDKEKATLLANKTLDFIEAQVISEDQGDWGLSFDDLSDEIDVPVPFSVSWNVTSSDVYSRTIALTVTWDGVGPDSNVVMQREVSSVGHVAVED